MASYWGPLRNNDTLVDATEVDTDINLNLVSVLNQVFDKAVNGRYRPEFQHGQSAQVQNGEFLYA